jgi:hypothetical protein
MRVMAAGGMRYLPEYSYSRDKYIYINAQRDNATPIGGYEWMLRVSAHEANPIQAGSESVVVRFDAGTVARVTIGGDSLLFNLGSLVRDILADSTLIPHQVPAGRLRLQAVTPRRRAVLALETVNGSRTGDSLQIQAWQGTLFLGRADRR